jgi:hypothetical protein
VEEADMAQDTIRDIDFGIDGMMCGACVAVAKDSISHARSETTGSAFNDSTPIPCGPLS